MIHSRGRAPSPQRGHTRHEGTALGPCFRRAVCEGLAELGAAAVDPGTDRAELDAQGRGDLLVRKTLDVAQDDRGPELRGQGVQGLLDVRVEVRVVEDLLRGRLAAGQSLGRVLPSASKRMRCLRRTMSRKRLVVMRCSQPSKVPGVYVDRERKTRTKTSWVRSSASCWFPVRRYASRYTRPLWVLTISSQVGGVHACPSASVEKVAVWAWSAAWLWSAAVSFTDFGLPADPRKRRSTPPRSTGTAAPPLSALVVSSGAPTIATSPVSSG